MHPEQFDVVDEETSNVGAAILDSFLFTCLLLKQCEHGIGSSASENGRICSKEVLQLSQ